MWFWIGMIITLTQGKFRLNNVVRSTPRRYVPPIHCDKVLILDLLLFLGMSVTIHMHFLDQHDKRSLKHQVGLLECQELSAYNAEGNKSGKVAGVPFVPTPINDWSQGFVSRQEDKLVFRCDSSAIKACKAVIEKLPSYPFAYYFLALCQKESGDQSWRQNAQKAKSVLEKTVRIPGHHSDHDLILGEVDKMLRNRGV